MCMFLARHTCVCYLLDTHVIVQDVQDVQNVQCTCVCYLLDTRVIVQYVQYTHILAMLCTHILATHPYTHTCTCYCYTHTIAVLTTHTHHTILASCALLLTIWLVNHAMHMYMTQYIWSHVVYIIPYTHAYHTTYHMLRARHTWHTTRAVHTHPCSTHIHICISYNTYDHMYWGIWSSYIIQYTVLYIIQYLLTRRLFWLYVGLFWLFGGLFWLFVDLLYIIHHLLTRRWCSSKETYYRGKRDLL
jgi:hypothetical protein